MLETQSIDQLLYVWRIQMTSYVWWNEKKIVQDVPLIMLNNFIHDQLFPLTKFQGLKRQLSGKFGENDKMTSLNDVIQQKRVMIWKKCPSDDDDQLQPWSRCYQIQVEVLKTA